MTTLFSRATELAAKHWYMSTIIIVDRIGERSRLQDKAHELGGVVIQMSGSYWPQQVSIELHKSLGFEHPLVTMPVADIEDFVTGLSFSAGTTK
jgi:hypothetical protein